MERSAVQSDLTIDITEQEAARRELEHSRKELAAERDRLRMLMEQVPAIIWSVDTDLVFLTNYGSGLTRLGLPQEHSVGLSMDEIGSAPPTIPSVRATLRDGAPRDYTVVYEDRSLRSHIRPLQRRSRHDHRRFSV